MKVLNKILLSTLVVAGALSPFAIYFLNGGQDINELKELLGASVVGFTTGGVGIGALILITTNTLSKLNNQFKENNLTLESKNNTSQKTIDTLVSIQKSIQIDNEILMKNILDFKNETIKEVTNLKNEVQLTNEKIKNGILKVVEGFNDVNENQEISTEIKEI
ncbi:MAG: hypothetical protein EOL97_14305 [Spirochaetia bacterium]|nr:hypothetical protein [Spirochaetia bacterium]